MSENVLFPVVDSPALTQEKTDYDLTYKPSIAWDETKGDFVVDGANRGCRSSGTEAYKTWCKKMALTERYACAAYPNELGAELEAALQEPDHKVVESALERTISEALLVNPKTEYVKGFEFTWNGDSVSCSFFVRGVDGDEFEVTI